MQVPMNSEKRVILKTSFRIPDTNENLRSGCTLHVRSRCGHRQLPARRRYRASLAICCEHADQVAGGVFREALVFAQAAQHHTDATRPSAARLCTANAGPARRSLGIDRSSGCEGTGGDRGPGRLRVFPAALGVEKIFGELSEG